MHPKEKDANKEKMKAKRQRTVALASVSH